MYQSAQFQKTGEISNTSIKSAETTFTESTTGFAVLGKLQSATSSPTLTDMPCRSFGQNTLKLARQ